MSAAQGGAKWKEAKDLDQRECWKNWKRDVKLKAKETRDQIQRRVAN